MIIKNIGKNMKFINFLIIVFIQFISIKKFTNDQITKTSIKIY